MFHLHSVLDESRLEDTKDKINLKYFSLGLIFAIYTVFAQTKPTCSKEKKVQILRQIVKISILLYYWI